MEKDNYVKAIRRIAKAFLFIMFNIYIGRVNVLPHWLGYILIYQTISSISYYSKSTHLLKPLVVTLIVYYGIYWVFEILGMTVDIYIIDIVVGVISVYVYFQLLTNIADIAKANQSLKFKRLYLLRTVMTIFWTMNIIVLTWNHQDIQTMWYIAIQVIITLWICITLYGYAKEVSNKNIDIVKV